MDDFEIESGLPSLSPSPPPPPPPVTSDTSPARGEEHPERILVQTLTQHVPGTGFKNKFMSMFELICMHVWGHSFDPFHENVNIYGAKFGYANRRCYFMVDHGKSPTGSEDPSLVPMRLFEYDGEKFTPWAGPLPEEMRQSLKEYLFKPKDENRTWVERPEKISPEAWRRFIKRKLQHDDKPNAEDFKFIRENPEHEEWLKEHLRPRFWERFKALALEDEEKVLGGGAAESSTAVAERSSKGTFQGTHVEHSVEAVERGSEASVHPVEGRDAAGSR